MGFFDLFWKRPNFDDDDEEDYEGVIDVEVVDTSLENVDFAKLAHEDRDRYVEEHCQIIVECNNNVEDAKKEYKMVSAYFSDIQIIESQSEKMRDKITYMARLITDLAVDRKMLFTEERKISGSRYLQMEREEDTMVDSIKNLKNNELYLQVVKKDMSALTGEKAALKMDSAELLQRQKIIKNITLVSMICFVIIFSVFIVAAFATETDYSTYFFVVLFVAAVFALCVFSLHQRTVYNTLLTEKKLNKAIALHNKVKIKYINTNNLIAYQYDKFGVQSSYELADLYQRYLQTKASREKYRQATLELSDNEEELEQLLDSLGLYDSKIWLSQVKALCDPREMVEIRHNYSTRRQTLRKYIEENSERAENSKKLLRDIIEDYPVYAPEVVRIVEKYDN